jgi:hypothetical protein
VPRFSAVALLQYTEQGVVVQPECLFTAKPVEKIMIFALLKTGKHFEKELLPDLPGPVKISLIGREFIGELAGFEVSSPGEALRADEERVSREGRRGTVGGKTERAMDGIEGKDLPVTLPGLGEKINETVRRGSQIPGSVKRRQGRDMI